MDTETKLSEYDVSIINAAILANTKVEIVPTKDGVKIYTIKRKEMNKKPKRD